MMPKAFPPRDGPPGEGGGVVPVSRYQRLFDKMLNGFAHCRMRFRGEVPEDFIYLDVNQAFVTQTGLKGVVGRWVSEIIPGIRESDPHLFELYGKVARTGVPTRFETYIQALGDWFDIAVYSPDTDEFVAVFDVITQRKRLELELIQSEENYRTLFDTVQQGVIYQDAEGRFLKVNPAAERILGLAASEMRGRTLPELGLEAELESGAPCPVEAFPARIALREGRPVDEVVLGVRHAGREDLVWVSSSAMPLFRKGEARPFQVYVTFRDISEQRRTEALQRKLMEEIQQAQKLESLGSLASGIAHDMNNVLAAIQAMTQTLKVTQPAGPDLLAGLETIERAAVRGRDTVQRFTNFTRKDLHHPEPVDLNALIREEEQLLGRTTLQKVALHLDLEEGLPTVLGERGHLGNVLMNLCINAVDAMPQGGTLAIRTRSAPGGKVRVEIEDTGTGMPGEVLSRATEPFFTTKPLGRGTGIGLAMVQATVKAHRGTIEIRSEVGKGTCVTLLLPRSGDAAARRAEDPAAAPGELPPRRILFVDDDDLVRASIPPLLAALGQDVAQASSGEEALALLRRGLAADLAILDLNMPGLTGVETLLEIRKIRPELPVLLISGHFDDETNALVQRDPRTSSLGKPFWKDDLSAALHRIFGARPPMDR